MVVSSASTGHVNAFALLDAESALTSTRESEARWQRGEPPSPVDGVPIALQGSHPGQRLADAPGKPHCRSGPGLERGFSRRHRAAAAAHAIPRWKLPSPRAAITWQCFLRSNFGINFRRFYAIYGHPQASSRSLGKQLDDRLTSTKLESVVAVDFALLRRSR